MKRIIATVSALLFVVVTAFVSKFSEKFFDAWFSPHAEVKHLEAQQQVEQARLAEILSKKQAEEARLAEVQTKNQKEQARLNELQQQAQRLEAQRQAEQTRIEILRQQNTATASTPPIKSNSLPQNVTTKRTFDPPFERYQDNGDGTVTDTKTHLMWKRCQEGQTWNNNTCEGTPSKITWNDAMPNEQQKTWPTFAGRNDWRMPKIAELRTLVYCSNGKPKYWNTKIDFNGPDGCEGDYKRPTIAPTVFPNTPKEGVSSDVWSSSPYADDSDNAWGVDFSDGTVNYYYARYYVLGVRLVR